MNLDSFIDSALSEPVQEASQPNAPVDLSLGELQSAKLVESRFGWSKVRRVVTAASALSGKYAPQTTPKSQATITKTSTDDECGFENDDSTPVGSEKHCAVSKQGKKPSSDAPSRPSTADAATAAVNAARAKLTFCVPESATHIRPRSAALHPSRDPQSMLAPVDEFVQIVRQERPKTASRLLDAGGSTTSQHSQTTRPRTATLRIAPPPPICSPEPVTETEIIQAMLATPEIAQSRQSEGLTLRLRERLISGNYSGLIYHDPNRQTNWRGVSDILAPAPIVRCKTEGDANDDTEVARMAPMADMRWAGKTLNTYRPWSPVRHTPSAHLKLNLSKVDGGEQGASTKEGSTSPGQPSSEPTSRIPSAQVTTRGTEGTAMPSARKIASARACDADMAEGAPECSQRRLRRPASDLAVTRERDEHSGAISSTGMDALFADGGGHQTARHLSSPALLSPPKGLVIGEASHEFTSCSQSPSPSPRRCSTAPDSAATLRPFNARPGSAVPSPLRPRPSTAGLPAAAGQTASNSRAVLEGARSNSSSALPQRTNPSAHHQHGQEQSQVHSRGHSQGRGHRRQHHNRHHSPHHQGQQSPHRGPAPGLQQSSSVFSSRVGGGSHHHTASRSTTGSRRAPLLINIITTRPILPSTPSSPTHYQNSHSSR